MQISTFQQVILSLTLPMATQALLGPFPFLFSFGLTEMFKLSYTALAGLANFCGALQLVFIANIRSRF